MTIQVITPAASKRMATVQEVADALGIDPVANQAEIEKLIDRASAMIVRYTGREFALEKVKEKVESRGEHTIVLSRTPVVTIYEVWHNGTQLTDLNSIWIMDAEAGIIWNDNTWTSTVIYRHNIEVYPTRFDARHWEIVYDGGYVMPDQSNPTLPKDLELACIELAKQLYLTKSQNMTIASEKIDTVSVTYRGDNDKFNIFAGVRDLLDPWVRIRV